MRPAWRVALLPVRALWAPGAAMDGAGSRVPGLAAGGLALLAAALGAAALPRLLPLLAASLGSPASLLPAAHGAALRAGLTRYLVADRLLPPLPYVGAALLLAAVAVPTLGTRGVAGRAVCGVLAVGAAPLLLQRLGELAVIWAAPGVGLEAGEVAGLAARFNVGVAGVLGPAGLAPGGALGVAAEAANAVGLWVVGLWGWGIARLERGAARPGARTPLPAWPFAAALLAYAAGYALYAAAFPWLLLLVMGLP